jgi:hypothetical protein
MRILTLVPTGILFIASICCCGGPGEPEISVRAGTCGYLEVEGSITPGRARTLAITRDDGERQLVEVDWFQSRFLAAVPSASASHLTVDDGSESVVVDAPEVSVPTLRLQAQEPLSAGEPAKLRVIVDGEVGCTYAGAIFLQVRDPSGMLIPQESILEGPADTFIIEHLTEGRHTAELLMRPTGRASLATGTEVLEVGPPCVDRDGDGALACKDDCDDADPSVHPGATDVPGDGIDNDCDGINGTDADRDGYEDDAAGGDDCDDENADIHPGAVLVDRDGDGFYGVHSPTDIDCDRRQDVPPGRGGDCDDTRAGVHPQSREPKLGNQLDDDCDGIVDEGTNLFDDDGDGQTEEEGDCDDTDSRRRLGGVEVYDCVDNDCNGDIDEGTTPRAVDDAFEPNDSQSAPLSTAQRNWLGGYMPTSDVIEIVSRDGQDTERFTVVAHDGLLDNFQVSVELLHGGQNIRYRAEIISPSGSRVSGVLSGGERSVVFPGTADHSDSGTYAIAIAPESSVLQWCPAKFLIESR